MNFRVYLPKQRNIRSFFSRQHFPAQRKGGGISKGGNLGSPLWLRAKHACIDCRLRKNKPDTHRLPRQHSTLFTAAPREYFHARPSECKRATTRTRVQRHAASVRARTANTGAAATLLRLWMLLWIFKKIVDFTLELLYNKPICV